MLAPYACRDIGGISLEQPAFLVELLLLVAIAALGVALADRLRLPSIVGFLALGALVGPHALGLVDDPERVRKLAELGVVFLLFEIGLELPVARLRSFLREAMTAGGLQVALTLALGAAAAAALGVPARSAWVVGALIAMSSTALVMGLLSDRGEVDAPHGQLATGILLFQDLCIVPFLLAVPLFAASQASGWQPVSWALLRAVLALGLLFAGARMGLPRLLDRAARTRSRELFALLAILVVLGSALAAEKLGLTLAVGAFIAGLALNASPYAHQLFAEVMPLRGVLLGSFFTAVGMLVDVGAAIRAPGPVLLYAAGVILAKTGIVAIVVSGVLRQGIRRGLLTGMALAQTGEFSFVLAASAAGAGLLDAQLHQTFLAGSVLTLAATPFLVEWAPGLASRVAARWPGRAFPESDTPVEQSDHVLIVGFGLAGLNVARVLRARRIPYQVVETNAATVRSAQQRGEPIHYGDATRPGLLERLGVQRARLAVIAVSDPPATREIVTLVHSTAPDVAVLARTRYVLDVDPLERAGATSVIAEEYESTLELVAETLRHFAVPEERIAEFAAGLRAEGYEFMRGPAAQILDPWLAELLEQDGTSWVEVPETFAQTRSLADFDLRARTGVNVVAVDRDGERLLNPAPDFELRADDRLLALGTPEALEKLRALLAEPNPGASPN
ncbi:MAG: cation:proton antiporter [Myxococcota bacterium]